jgi:hypothetical protein
LRIVARILSALAFIALIKPSAFKHRYSLPQLYFAHLVSSV